MKLVTYDDGTGPHTGVLEGGEILRLPNPSLSSLFASHNWLQQTRDLVRRAMDVPGEKGRAGAVPLSAARLLAPIPRPGRIAALGGNYVEHCKESKAKVPTEPVIFCKASTSVIGPGEEIVLPEASSKVDYEVELAFVMGRRAKLVRAADAMACVAGYTVLCDVSARDYQMEKPGGQWYLAKSFDTFCPTGPWIVTADEIPDPHALALSCEVSGEVLQSSSTRHMVFRIPHIVEYLSRVFTLEPGDIVATGTPSGVGFARNPPRFLRRGDVVRCEVAGIGALTNPVR